MSPVESVVHRVAFALRGYPVRRTYLVGVSGGRDSVVLIHLLHALGYRKLVVCHLDHGLRGRASTGDARFVERLAARLEYACVTDRKDVKALAAARHFSIETAAREARLEFFKATARTRRCSTLFVAHHADDQVETFLFNLLRGAGTAGLAGMRAVSGHDGLTIVRPLLAIWRSEIDAYATAHRLKFREDASNVSRDHTRNRLRHDVLPALEKAMGRDPRGALLRASQIIAAESDWVETHVPQFGSELPVAELRKLPEPIQRRAIARWLRQQNIQRIGFEEIERVRALIEPGAAVAKVNLPGDRYARRREKKLFLE